MYRNKLYIPEMFDYYEIWSTHGAHTWPFLKCLYWSVAELFKQLFTTAPALFPVLSSSAPNRHHL